MSAESLSRSLHSCDSLSQKLKTAQQILNSNLIPDKCAYLMSWCCDVFNTDLDACRSLEFWMFFDHLQTISQGSFGIKGNSMFGMLLRNLKESDQALLQVAFKCLRELSLYPINRMHSEYSNLLYDAANALIMYAENSVLENRLIDMMTFLLDGIAQAKGFHEKKVFLLFYNINIRHIQLHARNWPCLYCNADF